MQVNLSTQPPALKVVIALTLMSAGRMMTLAWVSRAGDGGPGDPPAAWLMPLIGDAAIGISALAVAFFLWKRATLATWTISIAWSAAAAFDAIAAFVVNVQSPWPDFFMLKVFGPTMFFAAAALHAAIIVLLAQSTLKQHFGVRPTPA